MDLPVCQGGIQGSTYLALVNGARGALRVQPARPRCFHRGVLLGGPTSLVSAGLALLHGSIPIQCWAALAQLLNRPATLNGGREPAKAEMLGQRLRESAGVKRQGCCGRIGDRRFDAGRRIGQRRRARRRIATHCSYAVATHRTTKRPKHVRREPQSKPLGSVTLALVVR